MPTPSQNSTQILCTEILADARRQRDEVISRAKQGAEALLAQTTAEADQLQQARRNEARLEGSRRKDLILATLPVEVGRLRAAHVEKLLDSIRDEVRQRLMVCEGFDCLEMVIVLAAEAISKMPGSAFTVRLSTVDRVALDDELAREISRRVGRSLSLTISNDAPAANPGAIIEDSAGHQLWDNRLLSRLGRLWPELRRQIAVQTGLLGEARNTGGGA